VYVRGDLWPRLWLANRDRVPDPRHPVPGTELKVPAPGPLTPAERAVLRAAAGPRR
jgi:nucleoid-associated protein YgaU